jgi:uncharacterized membrane protein YdjX (TVP38/TMEM64 family)
VFQSQVLLGASPGASHVAFMLPAAPSGLKLDRRIWRSLAGAFVTFGGVGLVFLFGARLLGLDGAEAVRSWLTLAAGSPWALPATVTLFAALAFLGVPQVVLIAAAIFALGPWAGMTDSWAGTMVSSLIGFWLGRRFGGGVLSDWGGARVGRIVALIARNGFLASLLIRLAPTAPFIFVNMAAGVAEVGLLDFAAGTAIGIVPKIALTALASGSLLGLAGAAGGQGALAVAVAAGGWVALTLVGFAWIRRREAGAAP